MNVSTDDADTADSVARAQSDDMD
eukprot:SAG31_NODE_37633_length_302_cov_1.428571_1_plen_23_part_01